ncbi:hypothetical protein [Nostoc sp.]|uniref:hypothetical protein n=1 Tax=Nostoc sp. TaxID=1180 RepID=UPI002FF91EF8
MGEIRFLDDGEWNQYPRLIPSASDRLRWGIADHNLRQTLFFDIAGLIAQVERSVVSVIKQVLSEG